MNYLLWTSLYRLLPEGPAGSPRFPAGASSGFSFVQRKTEGSKWKTGHTGAALSPGLRRVSLAPNTSPSRLRGRAGTPGGTHRCRGGGVSTHAAGAATPGASCPAGVNFVIRFLSFSLLATYVKILFDFTFTFFSIFSRLGCCAAASHLSLRVSAPRQLLARAQRQLNHTDKYLPRYLLYRFPFFPSREGSCCTKRAGGHF